MQMKSKSSGNSFALHPDGDKWVGRGRPTLPVTNGPRPAVTPCLWNGLSSLLSTNPARTGFWRIYSAFSAPDSQPHRR
jgi:hypothetical protein